MSNETASKKHEHSSKDLLLVLWQEDRAEIRLIKENIQTVCSSITLTSFAITAFLLGKDSYLETKSNSWLIPCADIFLIALLWMLVFPLIRDLKHARKSINLRQRLICEQLKPVILTNDPFQNAEGEPVDIKDHR